MLSTHMKLTLTIRDTHNNSVVSMSVSCQAWSLEILHCINQSNVLFIHNRNSVEIWLLQYLCAKQGVSQPEPIQGQNNWIACRCYCQSPHSCIETRVTGCTFSCCTYHLLCRFFTVFLSQRTYMGLYPEKRETTDRLIWKALKPTSTFIQSLSSTSCLSFLSSVAIAFCKGKKWKT